MTSILPYPNHASSSTRMSSAYGKYLNRINLYVPRFTRFSLLYFIG